MTVKGTGQALLLQADQQRREQKTAKAAKNAAPPSGDPVLATPSGSCLGKTPMWPVLTAAPVPMRRDG